MLAEVIPTIESDDGMLRSMGYQPELRRGLQSAMNFAFGFTEVSVFASLLGTMGIALVAGGPPMLLCGWIVGSCLTICCGLSMAEICSAYPSAGSVYHWAGNIPPPDSAPAWSYVTGLGPM